MVRKVDVSLGRHPLLRLRTCLHQVLLCREGSPHPPAMSSPEHNSLLPSSSNTEPNLCSPEVNPRLIPSLKTTLTWSKLSLAVISKKFVYPAASASCMISGMVQQDSWDWYVPGMPYLSPPLCRARDHSCSPQG